MMKFTGFNIETDLEKEALRISGAKNKRILYTRALEFCMKRPREFSKVFDEFDQNKLKDLLKK